MQRIYDTKLYETYRPTRTEVLNGEMWLKLKFLRQNLARAANRGEASQHIDVSLDYLYSVGDSQSWKCALSGVPLEFTRGGTNWGNKWCNPRSCTIDRIDSNKGYIEGNIQLVTWEINAIKSHHENEHFINLCKWVAEFNK